MDISLDKMKEAFEAQERAEKIAITEEILGKLLHLTHQSLAMQEFLKQALDMILVSIPWLGILPRGGIFLTDKKGQEVTLKLVVTHNLAPDQQMSCARVQFGKCMCGRAAVTRDILFSERIDHRHDIRYEGDAAWTLQRTHNAERWCAWRCGTVSPGRSQAGGERGNIST